ncbi:MAG: DUF3472 domain-containing protein [Prosthecobacter sp.]|uniref:DUF3472 domain-containing protein n=1 Tax=Prosthecobacter sp. TaxID=1965333 RepID=UPI00390437F3
MNLRLITLLGLLSTAHAELSVPGFTAYIEPDFRGLEVSKEKGITHWQNDTQRVLWFGEVKTPGKLRAKIKLSGDEGRKLRLNIAETKREAVVTDGVAAFGDFEIAKAGYVRFELVSLSDSDGKGIIESLVLDGPATTDANFNLDPRRNAASVHLMYPTPKDEKIAMFYNEVTAVKEPLYTFYMACGFSRGYFGMQINSASERRIIFSVWDAGSGQKADDRSAVAADDQTQLLAKGEGVEASVFGNEGTGGHSHLVYPWKTGETQKFVVAVKPDGSHTTYSGYWFHPEKKAWMLIASFRAPKDGKYLRGLHSFSENFGGQNGHQQRKALYGPQWIANADGKWTELTTAKFSHDPTGKAHRLDRFMGVEAGKFFLSHGGFVEGFTKYGEPFTRPATNTPPTFKLP